MQNACVRLEQTKEFPRQRLLEKEREAIGVYISGHPLDDYASTLFTLEYTVSQLQEADGSEAPYDNARVQTGGLLSSIERKPTRNGNNMVGYAVLEGISGSIELLLFKNTLDAVSDLFTSGRAVLVNGRLSLKEGAKNSIIVSNISTLKNIKPTLYMRFDALTPEKVKEIVELLSGYPGNVPVMVYDASTGEQRLSPKELNVNLSDAFLTKARALAGKENIRISAK
ncbi:MAG: DNA polymerase III subunit alpha [Firmicutes bacterium ADurb.Bin356]|nr:MAG: DNA polymerase III subunit alpha [Firmicutes bacterium ADurb.Bin356]